MFFVLVGIGGQRARLDARGKSEAGNGWMDGWMDGFLDEWID